MSPTGYRKLVAYENLLIRLNDIQQLLDVPVETQKGNRLTKNAINRAAIVLLCAQLEAFIEELYSEATQLLLIPYVLDVQALIDQGLSSFSNPQPYRVNRLFATIGFSNILTLVSWQGTNAKSITKKLSSYVELRNSIAHGKNGRISKTNVVEFKKFIELFAKNLQDWVASLSLISDLALPARRSQVKKKVES